MSPSATPATQKAAASQATSGDQALATQNEGRCHQFLRLPLPRIKPADQLRHQTQPSAIRATPAMQKRRRRHQVPRLPRRRKVDVTKRHACHAKGRGVKSDQWRPSACHAKWRPMSPILTPAIATHKARGPIAPPEPTQCHKCHACHAKATWVWPSATRATQTKGQCHQVPRLPHKNLRAPEPTQCHKCHACHAKAAWMSASATLAT